MIFLVYFFTFLISVISIVLFLMGIEQLVTIFIKIAPSVSAGKKKTAAVVNQIKKDFPNAKTVLDIGSGWGNMVCCVAKNFPSAQVVGVEIMPTPYVLSIIRCARFKNIKIIFGDVFKYLNKDKQKFDIGISYLLTPEMKNVEKFLERFKILLSVDFPLPDSEPTEKIKIYHDGKVQHWLYVYNNK